MMTKTTISLKKAEKIAQDITSLLKPYCLKVKTAGSVRRKVPTPGDIEIVADPIPLTTEDLFGKVSIVGNELMRFDFGQIGQLIKSGPKYKEILVPEGIKLDLFIVTPPAQWGAIFMIRTGPGSFSKKMVTAKRYGGNLPSCYKQKDGAVWQGNQIIEMPSERDYFELCEMAFVKPEDRR